MDSFPDPHAGDELAYREAWEGRLSRSSDEWTCPGCGSSVEPSDVRRHVSECDRVDGAGRPITPDELEEDETGQTTLGVPGEQRAIGGLAAPRPEQIPEEESALEEAARLARVRRLEESNRSDSWRQTRPRR